MIENKCHFHSSVAWSVFFTLSHFQLTISLKVHYEDTYKLYQKHLRYHQIPPKYKQHFSNICQVFQTISKRENFEITPQTGCLKILINKTQNNLPIGKICFLLPFVKEIEHNPTALKEDIIFLKKQNKLIAQKLVEEKKKNIPEEEYKEEQNAVPFDIMLAHLKKQGQIFREKFQKYKALFQKDKIKIQNSEAIVISTFNGKFQEKDNGKYKIVILFNENGEQFQVEEGEIDSHMKLSGMGTIYYQNQIKHDGEFKDNAYNGYGIITSKTKGLKRQGTFKNGRQHGKMIEYCQDGSTKILVYHNGHLKNEILK